MAYKLKLPAHSQVHPVLHISLLKKKSGQEKVVCQDLPILGADGQPKIEPIIIMYRRLIKRKHKGVVQWLIRWVSLSDEEATWEDAEFIQQQCPTFKS